MDWILRNARIDDDRAPVDVGIQAGKIARIATPLAVGAAAAWDLEGRVLLPGFVDIHTHLDKAYSAIDNPSGTLQEAIERWRQIKRTRSADQLWAAGRRSLQNAVLHGVTALRSHIDTFDAGDLATVEILLALREEWRDRIELQFVALGDPGGDHARRQVMEQALLLGLDAVGGAPSLTPDPRQSIDGAFALAERFDLPIDLHIDETEDPQMRALEYLAEQTLARRMQGRVTAGHCCSLAFMQEEVAARIMDKVAAADLHVVTLPSCNLVLMGRGMRPAPRGGVCVKDLLDRGVTVSAASDNVADPFNPFGAYDLLQIANLNAHVAQLSGTAELYTALAMVTSHPARGFGRADARIAVGEVADLVVVDAWKVLNAVTSPPPRLATFKAGKRIVHTQISRDWAQVH